MNNLVAFDSEYCKGCELCINFCPPAIIKLDSKIINSKGYRVATILDSHMVKCIACGNCATMCPDSVISIERDDSIE